MTTRWMHRTASLLVVVLAASALTWVTAAEASAKSKKPTSVTIAAPARAYAGSAIAVSGRLTSKRKPVKKAAVRIQALRGRTWTTIKTARTDSRGGYRATIAGLTRSTVLRASFAGNRSYRAKNSGGRTVAVVARPPGPPTVRTLSLPQATRGRAYRFQLVAGEGKAPLSWRLSAGSLPPGLDLSPAGVLTGTPTKAGTEAFTVQVRDAAGRTAARQLSLTVVADGTALPALPAAVVDAARFLTTGTPAIQEGVAADTLKDDQVAIVLGTVVKAGSDQPVKGPRCRSWTIRSSAAPRPSPTGVSRWP